MKFSLFALFSLFLGIGSLAASAQVAPTKLAFIDTEAFLDGKAGINKYVNAYKSLADEFKAATDEINNMNTRLNALSKEAQAIQDKLNGPALPGTDPTALRTSLEQKMDEGQRLQIDLKRKQEDTKAKYEKREAAVAVPIMREIGAAIEVYRKAKGYDLILNAAKLGESILGYEKSLDITDAFIADFNLKSGGAPVKP